MLKRFFILLVFLSPLAVSAAGADVFIGAGDIRFSKLQLIAGDQVRIYATVHNIGSVDVAGYVSFFQGSVPIGNSQVVSSVAGGDPDGVYVDFVIPASEFNIRAEIRGTDPADTNASNDTAITSMFTPVMDDDRDGIENQKDNCPTNANANQLDSDSDTHGDLCDDDDDNDGLSDAVEQELGTNPLDKDSDHDGVQDPNDAFPTNPNKTTFEVKKPPAIVKPAPVSDPIVVSVPPSPSKQVSNQDVKPKSISNIITSVVTQVKDGVGRLSEPQPTNLVSANAVFTYEHPRWNTFTFRLLAPEQIGYVYEWDFGDGGTSSHAEVEHSYKKSGAYHVTLTTHTQTGEQVSESVEVLVPFFSLQNQPVFFSLIGLFVVLLASLFFSHSLGKNIRRGSDETDSGHVNNEEDTDQEDVDSDEPHSPVRRKRILVKED